jgi:Restriction endonuclease
MKRVWLFVICFLLSCILIFVSLPAALKFVLLLLDLFLIFGSLALVLSIHPQANQPRVPVRLAQQVSLQPVLPKEYLPHDIPAIPRTTREILARMTSEQFEWFSAAIIIGLREGHTFMRHCGGRGDRGVDVKLRNKYNFIIAVQSKHYSPTHVVPPKEIRDFAGSIPAHNANYGYFVTTSTLTKQAQIELESRRGLIRLIDGRLIDIYLQSHYRDIALAWQDLQKHM